MRTLRQRVTSPRRDRCGVAGVALVIAGLCACGHATSISSDAPAAPTAGTPLAASMNVVRVSSTGQLQAAVAALVSGQTIELAPGVYSNYQF